MSLEISKKLFAEDRREPLAVRVPKLPTRIEQELHCDLQDRCFGRFSIVALSWVCTRRFAQRELDNMQAMVRQSVASSL